MAAVHLGDVELIAKARLYADQFCPGWSVGSLAIWAPGRKPQVTAFTPEREEGESVTAEVLKEMMRDWASTGRDWRACAIVFRLGEVGEVPAEQLVVRNLLVAAA